MSFLLLQSASSPSPVLQFLPLLLIFAIFYFLLFLPMQRQKKKQQQMLSELKTGDEVITTGGIVGTIVSVNQDDTIVLRVKPSDTKLTFIRGAVSAMAQTEKKS
jgi:preprotein translocase subunit YajC